MQQRHNLFYNNIEPSLMGIYVDKRNNNYRINVTVLHLYIIHVCITTRLIVNNYSVTQPRSYLQKYDVYTKV